MGYIKATNVCKEFQVTLGKKGFKGSIHNLINPDKKIIKALNSISFSINEGEILGLLGPNGAGKSTMVKILTGILTPTSGEAMVNGIIPYKKPRENAKQIGVVFGQRSRLWWNLPVNDSFEYSKAIYAIPNDVFNSNVDYFKAHLGIEEIINKPVRTLSLGQKMRAEISMAMLHSPGILYLDEPTIGLDIVGKSELHKLIKQINIDRKVTVLLVTHDVIDIERLCSRVIIIDKGQLIWEGDIEGLKKAKGNKRVFDVLFEFPVDVIKSELFNPIECSEVKHQYICEGDVIDIEKIIKEFFSAGKVIDLTVNDSSIEEVIRSIYTQ